MEAQRLKHACSNHVWHMQPQTLCMTACRASRRLHYTCWLDEYVGGQAVHCITVKALAAIVLVVLLLLPLYCRCNRHQHRPPKEVTSA